MNASLALAVVLGLGGLLAALVLVGLFSRVPAGRGGRSWLWGGIAVAALGVGLAGYIVTGRPGLADQPISGRVAAIQARMAAIDPSAGAAGLQAAGITGEEVLALLESAKRANPDDPRPHFFIANHLLAMDRPDEAGRAFQSALRRDPEFLPAILGLADLYVSLDGRVGPDAERLFAEAARLAPQELRPRIMLGVARMESGDTVAASAIWDGLEAEMGADDPRRAMIAAMRARTSEVGMASQDGAPS
jgi:cytochrome c-type biogenesis protein CcmH